MPQQPSDDIKAAVLKKIKEIHQKNISAIRFLPLNGGWGNLNHKVSVLFDTNEEVFYFLKSLMPYNASYLNRKQEHENIEKIFQSGIGPTLICKDESIGFQLFEFLDNHKTLCADDFKRKKIITSVAQSLKHLHSQASFKNTLNPFERSQKVRKHIESKTHDIDPRILELEKTTQLIESHLKKALAPSHNDTTPSNFMMNNNGKVTIIDFENSGNNDPFWDLAYLSVETNLTEEQDNLLLHHYHDGTSWEPANGYLKLILYKLMIMHWISLFTKLQSIEKNPSQPISVFEEKSTQTIERAFKFMASNTFKKAMDGLLSDNNPSRKTRAKL